VLLRSLALIVFVALLEFFGLKFKSPINSINPTNSMNPKTVGLQYLPAFEYCIP